MDMYSSGTIPVRSTDEAISGGDAIISIDAYVNIIGIVEYDRRRPGLAF